jgi:hypothetical protein
MEDDPKVLFQHLYKELTEYQLRFADLSVKGTGLTLLVLGWMLTSDSARSYLATSTAGRLAAIVGIVIMQISFIFIAVRMGRVMRKLAQEIEVLNYVPPSYYEHRAFPPRVLFISGALALVPSVIAIALMLVGAR